MAAVYLAHDLKHDRQVALKVLRAELAQVLGPERFLREIKIAARLEHPHILMLFDSGDADGLLYYVMPFVDGESLRDRMTREGPLPLGDALRLTAQVADALTYAHAKGVVHRDIKSENILLSGGYAKVADFGIALSAGPSDHKLGPSSNVYALASILYELLTGEMPFTGATVQAILVKRLTHDAPRARARRGDIPMACDAVIARALAREPQERFATAAAFAEALVDRAVAAPRTGERSIAVLPFANLSTDAENGYFSDVLTEEVITTLSKVGTLRVISRGTMMKFRDRSRGATDVARELGVTHALGGSVRKSGNRLRITAALVAADSDVSLWTERFDGVLDGVFDMQDRVATAVVQALDLVLTHEGRVRAERPWGSPPHPGGSRPVKRTAASTLRPGVAHLVRQRRRLRALRRPLFEAFGDPDLDDRLPRDAESRRFLIERIDHPHRKVHVHATRRLRRTTYRGQVEITRDVDVAFELAVKLLRLHTTPPPQRVHGAPISSECGGHDR